MFGHRSAGGAWQFTRLIQGTGTPTISSRTSLFFTTTRARRRRVSQRAIGPSAARPILQHLERRGRLWSPAPNWYLGPVTLAHANAEPVIAFQVYNQTTGRYQLLVTRKTAGAWTTPSEVASFAESDPAFTRAPPTTRCTATSASRMGRRAVQAVAICRGPGARYRPVERRHTPRRRSCRGHGQSQERIGENGAPIRMRGRVLVLSGLMMWACAATVQAQLRVEAVEACQRRRTRGHPGRRSLDLLDSDARDASRRAGPVPARVRCAAVRNRGTAERRRHCRRQPPGRSADDFNGSPVSGASRPDPPCRAATSRGTAKAWQRLTGEISPAL